jgi:aminoglycoside phosphotransferase (APT) family kinase protein
LARGQEIVAVVDWEIWALSDPRIDVAWFLHVTGDSGGVSHAAKPAGVPTGEDLMSEYYLNGGMKLGDLQWFRALACWKQAAAYALHVKHSRRSQLVDPAVDAFAASIPILIGSARRMLV